MVTIYPEQWPGWVDHARQGGGLFDSPESFAQVIHQCWEHYKQASQVAQRVSLSPPPDLRLYVTMEALQTPAWQAHFHYLREWFQPVLNGVPLPLHVTIVDDERADALSEPRHFFFQVVSEAASQLRCYFFAGRQAVGAVSLGMIEARGDQRRLQVHRNLLGRTKGSDLASCFQDSPLWGQLSPEMQEDFKYIGWDFNLVPHAGEFKVAIQNIPSMGFLEGGDFLLQDDQTFWVGESIDFYQGLHEGRPAEDLRCRLLLLTGEEQPIPPSLRSAELVVHNNAKNQGPPLVEVHAQVTGMTSYDSDVTLQLEPGSHQVTLKAHNVGNETSLFVGTLKQWNPAWDRQEVRCLPFGANRFGLSFPPHVSTPARVKKAVVLSYEGPTALPKSQLQREWELTFLMKDTVEPPNFALNDLTLVLEGSDQSQLRLPLANIIENRLMFRYLPRFASQQVSLDDWQQHDNLSLWVEHIPSQTDDPEAPVLSRQDNQAEAPLQKLRLLDLDETSRLLPSEAKVGLPSRAELVTEGYRLQVVGPLTLSAQSDQAPETWDLVLWTPAQPRQLELLHQGMGWMQVLAPSSSSQTSMTNRDARSLWLSCGHKDNWIEQPRERNPQGGPCFAFGLGFGSQNEMAQIRPTSDGFRLYRHRHNTSVICNGNLLTTEPYHQAQGFTLSENPSTGWILVDRALLRYRVDQVQGVKRLSLRLMGYLIKRPESSTPTLQVLLGPTHNLHPPPHSNRQISQLRLSEEGKPTVLTLSLPQRPVHHTYPPLVIQERRGDALSSPLRFGQAYPRHALSLTFWQVHDPETRQTAQHPSLPELPLFLDVSSMMGRYRYALVRSHGRLGYWYEGSQFIESHGESEPMLAPDYTRMTLDNQEIDPHTLLLGSDVTQADLLLPVSLRWSDTLPFGLRLEGRTLEIVPLQSECSLWEWQTQHDGVLHHKETLALDGPLRATLPDKGRLFFRCGHYLFEVSTEPRDLQGMPQAEIALSIRGVFYSALQPITIGGTPETATLSIADPIPGHPIVEPLMQIYPPSLSLVYRGDGIVGLRQAGPHDTLRWQLEQDLASAAYSFSNETPMQLLEQILPEDNPSPTLPTPDLLHNRAASPWPEGFLRSSAYLNIEDTTLQYHLRQSPDLYPSPGRVPAWMTLEPSPTFFFPFADGPDGLLHPQGKKKQQVDTVHVGRFDPESTYGLPNEHSNEEALLSPVVNEGGTTSTKINLFGYSPRYAFQLRREGGQVYLDIPAPSGSSPYHIVLKDQPIHSATRYPITEPTYLHINHLLVCSVFPHEDGVRFVLLGYLLGHQRDPARPVVLGHTNQAGWIYLHSIEHNAKIALQRAQCPAHFIAARNAEDNDSIEPKRTLGPLSLPNGVKLGLVDLQQEKSQHPAFQRPPYCDRLLWFDTPSTEGSYLFPSHTLPPPRTPNTPAPVAMAPIKEESSFFFDDPSDSQGSSFFFDDPADDVVPLGGKLEPPTDGFATATLPHGGPGITEPAAQELKLGWFPRPVDPASHFGYVSSVEGPQLTLQLTPHRLRMVPPSQSMSDISQPAPIALWRMGRWQPITTPCDLPETSLVQCGRAVFSLSYQREEARVWVQRRWLWLPSHQAVELQGAPETWTSTLEQEENLPVSTSSHALPSPQDTDTFAAPSTPRDASEAEVTMTHDNLNAATSDAPVQAVVHAEQTLQLTDLPTSWHGWVMPPERGHRVEVKRRLKVLQDGDNLRIVPAATEASTTEP